MSDLVVPARDLPYVPSDAQPLLSDSMLRVRSNDGDDGASTALWKYQAGAYVRVGVPAKHASQHAPGGTDVLANVPVFQSATAYPANYVIQQSGALYYRTSAGTSGASWAADSANWTAVSNAGGSQPAAHAATHQLGGTDALSLSQYDRDLALTGIITPMPPGMGGSSTTAMTAGRLFYGRFVPSRAMTITLAAFAIPTTASSVNDPVEIAIFDATGANRLGTTGSTLGKTNSTGVQTINFSSSVSLAARTAYYVAILQTTIGGTAASFHAMSMTSNIAADLFGATLPNRLMSFLSGQASMPTTLPAGSAQNAMPLIALRES